MKKAKLKLISSMIFLTVILSVIAYAVVVGRYTYPADEFYLIKNGSVMGNPIFTGNFTPSGPGATIQNVTLYHNLSGTFSPNSTNTTPGTVATTYISNFDDAYRSSSNWTILSNGVDLADGTVFEWNLYGCDNKTIFLNEPVIMDYEAFGITLDNFTGTGGNGTIIRGSTGKLSNFPVKSVEFFSNSTPQIDGTISCNLTSLTEGKFYCNATKEYFNTSAGGTDVYKENLITDTILVNYTINSSCRFAGVNRVVFVEDAPNITLSIPADNTFLNETTVTINFTVVGDSPTYTCSVYTNDTGSWVEEDGGVQAFNNSLKTTSKVISEGNSLYNIRCAESANSQIFGWAPLNFTVTIDATSPAITYAAKDYGINKAELDGYSGFINLTVTDANPVNCTLYINGTRNTTTEGYISGVNFTQFFNASDGVYNWMIECNDTAKRLTTIANTSMIIDTVFPTLTFNGTNKTYPSTGATCEKFTVEFTLSEAANATIKYGTTSMSQTHTVTKTSFSTNQTLNITFNTSYEAEFYVNLTFYDRAGNFNDSIKQQTFISPVPLCTGWSLYSVYDGTITMNDYRVASGADYLYWWNNSNQEWASDSSAGSNTHRLTTGDVVQLFESINTTYFRNNTGNPDYKVNITGGHMYFGLYNDYSFGNISHNIFLNETYGNVTGNLSNWYFGSGVKGSGPSDTSGLEFRIDYLAGFNNTGQFYVDAPYKWAWNNDTVLGKSYKNGLDTLWAYIPYNLSINFTTNGSVIGNWS